MYRPRYLFYYENEDEPRPGHVPASVIWRGCLYRAMAWTAACAAATALIVLAGAVGYL